MEIGIIGNGNVGQYLQRTLSKDFNVQSFSARELVHSTKNTKQNILDVLQLKDRFSKGGILIFSGKSGDLLDILIDIIQQEFVEYKNQFYIFGTNGAILYGDNIPRMVLNSAIKQEQALGISTPTPFGESLFYHPSPGNIENTIVGKLNFPILITSNRENFLKAFYLKLGINTIFNSLGVLYNSSIGDSVTTFETNTIYTLEDLIKEVSKVMQYLYPELTFVEIKNSIFRVKDELPSIWASTVSQFYTDSGVNYKNSDIQITLGFVIEFAIGKNIKVPALEFIYENIIKLNNLNYNGKQYV